MDRLTSVIVYQWRAYWRRFVRSGRLSAGNQGVMLIISALFVIKYAQKLTVASREISHGQTSTYQVLLAGVLCAWLLAFNNRERDSDGIHRLLALPISVRELFIIRVASLMTPPYVWLLVAASVALCYPLRNAPHPFAGSLAALIFAVFSLLCGVTISSLLNMRWWRRMLGAAGLVLTGLTSAVLLRSTNVHFDPVQLSLPPMNWVALVAMGARNRAFLLVACLILLMVAASYAALISFRAGLQTHRNTSHARTPLFHIQIPGALGGLINKELRYYRRLLDVYLGVLAAAAGTFYLFTVDVASLDIVIIFLMGIFLPNSPLAFNSFGLDTPNGLDRYSLLGISAKALLFSKNLAFALILLIQTTPLLALGFMRLGIEDGLYEVATIMGLLCAHLTWGNWMSINHPVKLHFFRFSTSTSSVVDSMAGVMFSISPAVLIIFLLHSQFRSLIPLVPVLFGLMYTTVLLMSQSRLTRKGDLLRRALG